LPCNVSQTLWQPFEDELSGSLAILVQRVRDTLLKLLDRSSFGHNVLVLGGGTAVAQAVVVLTSPILSRLYTPADFGVLTVYVSIVTILSIVASLRYELAIPLPEREDVAAGLLALSILCVAVVSTLVALATSVLREQIPVWTNTPAFRPHLWTLSMGLAATGVYQILSYWAVREKAFRRLARTRLSQSLGTVLTQLLLGVATVGPLGLLLGQVVGQITAACALATGRFRESSQWPKKIGWTSMYSAAARYRRFPLLSTGSGLLNSAGLQLPPLLLATFFDTEVVGWFALGRRVVTMPMILVGQSVAQVYVGEASRMVHKDAAALYRLYLKTAGRLALIGGLPIALLGLVAPPLFAFVFGEPWREAGRYVQVLAVMSAAQFVVVPLSNTLNVLERQDLQLGWDAARLVLVVGAMFLANSRRLPPIWTIVAYGTSGAVAYIALFVLSWAILRQVALQGAR
jgi:O-antigen/teichoic acid export membrane protein